MYRMTALIMSDNNLGNIFDSAEAAIRIDSSGDFSITSNTISGFSVGIEVSKSLYNLNSSIVGNTIEGADTAVLFQNSNLSGLDVSCNTFDYAQYGIYSHATWLKNQGSPLEGAGNVFISASTNVNKTVRHNGNAMIYYYDPSEPVSLITNLTLTAVSQAALAGNACDELSRKGNLDNDATP